MMSLSLQWLLRSENKWGTPKQSNQPVVTPFNHCEAYILMLYGSTLKAAVEENPVSFQVDFHLTSKDHTCSRALAMRVKE